MRIHLQPYMLQGEAKFIQDRRVLLGFKHEFGYRIGRRTSAGERCEKPLAVRDLRCHSVRRHVCIRWNLYRQLATSTQRGGPSAENPGMVRDPLQRSASKHKVMIVVARPDADVAMLEPNDGSAAPCRFGQHRCRVVDAHHFRASELSCCPACEFAWSASEVGRSRDRPGLDQRRQVDERLSPLVRKRSIGRGTPGISHTCIVLVCMPASSTPHEETLPTGVCRAVRLLAGDGHRTRIETECVVLFASVGPILELDDAHLLEAMT